MHVSFHLDTAIESDKRILADIGNILSGNRTAAPTYSTTGDVKVSVPEAAEEKPKRKRGPNKPKKADPAPPSDPEPTPIEAAKVSIPREPESPPDVADEEVTLAFKKYASGVGYKNALAFLQENFGVKRLSLVPAKDHGDLLAKINAS